MIIRDLSLILQTKIDCMKTYICIVCGFVYDEAAGRPEDGIAAGTAWADVPGDWSCPDCGVAKADFEAVAI
jgi:rubredoxin